MASDPVGSETVGRAFSSEAEPPPLMSLTPIRIRAIGQALHNQSKSIRSKLKRLLFRKWHSILDSERSDYANYWPCLTSGVHSSGFCPLLKVRWSFIWWSMAR